MIIMLPHGLWYVLQENQVFLIESYFQVAGILQLIVNNGGHYNQKDRNGKLESNQKLPQFTAFHAFHNGSRKNANRFKCG